ncbi:MAG TPA: hypothetical protein VF219_02940 [Vicinamibacterales bacterium]
MHRSSRTRILAAVLSALAPAVVAAQNVGIRLMHDGDCTITVDWPANTDVSGFRLLINGQPATRVVLEKTAPFTVTLAEPVRERDNVSATAAGLRYDTEVNGLAPGAAPVESCGKVQARDDERSVFEASGFLGNVFDNFAPNVAGGYKDPVATAAATQVKSRWTAGVIAQYRLLGNPGDTYQLWLASYTLHGVRTSDVDCSVPTPPPVCSKTATTADKFLFVVEHASTLEAHIDARLEFATLQKDSELPIKVFAAARFGFLNLEGAPQVYNSNSLGVGILAPKGVFRNSLAQVAWGLSEQFGSDPRWNRLKVNGLLAFDLMPSLKDRLEFWKRLGGSTRFFVEISVDRNLQQGPDAVQTYVGLLFDLRQAFAGFR